MASSVDRGRAENSMIDGVFSGCPRGNGVDDGIRTCDTQAPLSNGRARYSMTSGSFGSPAPGSGNGPDVTPPGEFCELCDVPLPLAWLCFEALATTAIVPAWFEGETVGAKGLPWVADPHPARSGRTSASVAPRERCCIDEGRRFISFPPRACGAGRMG